MININIRHEQLATGDMVRYKQLQILPELMPTFKKWTNNKSIGYFEKENKESQALRLKITPRYAKQQLNEEKMRH